MWADLLVTRGVGGLTSNKQPERCSRRDGGRLETGESEPDKSLYKVGR
jgi:hypothetical protein